MVLKFHQCYAGAESVTLPLYLVPVLNVIVFYGINAYLLGREYFEMVALRRLDPSQCSAITALAPPTVVHRWAVDRRVADATDRQSGGTTARGCIHGPPRHGLENSANSPRSA